MRIFDLFITERTSPWRIACSLLPVGASGKPDTDLSTALVGTSIEITEPICGEGYDPPMPWWTTPGASEPQPPGLGNDDSPAE